MLRLATLALCLATALPLAAQEPANRGSGAVLRGLDKVSGETTDLELGNGAAAEFGNLRIDMRECRYPEGDPSGDAFAFLDIWEHGGDAPLFSGWMIASSPALNALDHARYDVWVMRCTS